MPSKLPIDSRTSHHITSRGFTLLEVLIVLAMLLFGLAVVSELMNGSLRQADDTEERTEIQLVCQNRLNEIAAGALTVSPGVPETVPSFPHWVMRTFLEGTPLPNVTACTVVAQKYETTRDVPIEGKQIVFKQWMTRDSIQVALATTSPDGQSEDQNPFSFQADPQGDRDLFRDAGFSDGAPQSNGGSTEGHTDGLSSTSAESVSAGETEGSP
ncbi:MAG: type II secretion system protein [Planctomycetia bacterium]|nr:type II secretion system protein [Planctomycetia bacterium]